MSKSFTAAGAVLLEERGAIDLDEPISRYLPDWNSRPAGAATARLLAGHLGGIRHYREGEGIRYDHFDEVTAALGIFADDPLLAPPGAKFEYSTYGYSLLSAVMQVAADRPFLTWMQREVFEALGMYATGPDLTNRVIPNRASFYEIRRGRLTPASHTDNSYKWAGGGFLSTPTDMVRFGRGLLEGDLLARSAVETLFTTQVTTGGDSTGYGMGFRPRRDAAGRRILHHGGSAEGGRAFLAIYPDEELVIALTANRSTAPLFAEEVQVVAHLLLDHGPGTPGFLDVETGGAWSVEGTLADDPVKGALSLYPVGSVRGWFEWSADQAPIEIVLVDRHGTDLRLVGVGPHGAMTADLEPHGPDGWTGSWEYLGRRGDVHLRRAR